MVLEEPSLGRSESLVFLSVHVQLCGRVTGFADSIGGTRDIITDNRSFPGIRMKFPEFLRWCVLPVRRSDRCLPQSDQDEGLRAGHRFRHTFVRILLEKGIPVGDVAELIGDTVRTLLKYYAKWVPSRQAPLTGILKEAFFEKLMSVTRSVSI